MKKVRRGALYILRPAGIDLADPRVTHWTDHLVQVTQPHGCPTNGTMGHCYVESRLGEFIGLVLVNSLQQLDKQTKNALRRERYRKRK